MVEEAGELVALVENGGAVPADDKGDVDPVRSWCDIEISRQATETEGDLHIDRVRLRLRQEGWQGRGSGVLEVTLAGGVRGAYPDIGDADGAGVHGELGGGNAWGFGDVHGGGEYFTRGEGRFGDGGGGEAGGDAGGPLGAELCGELLNLLKGFVWRAGCGVLCRCRLGAQAAGKCDGQ